MPTAIGKAIGTVFQPTIVSGVDPHPGSNILMETGDNLLMETGDALLLE